MKKSMLLAVLAILVVGITLTGCPSGNGLSVTLLWQDEDGWQSAQTIYNLGWTDAPYGAMAEFEGGRFQFGTVKYKLQDFPEVITMQVVVDSEKSLEVGIGLLILAGHIIPAIIDRDDTGFTLVVPMGTAVETAVLEVTTTAGQFAYTFRGEAYYGNSGEGEGESHHLSTMVSPANSGGINVNPDCGSYQPGTVVAIEAVANNGYAFDHWMVNGAVGTSDPVAQVTMDSDVSVTAIFSGEIDPITTGKIIIDLTTAAGIVSLKADAPDGYSTATFGGIGDVSQIQSIGLQLYYEAAVSGLWTDRQTFAFGNAWPVTGVLTKISGKTLRFEVVANSSGSWGDPDKLIVQLNGTLVPRVLDASGYTAYQVTLPKLG